MEPINKVGVDSQIADERMAVGEGKDFLFALLADQAAKIFEAVGAGFKRLGAGAVDGSCRVLFYQSAQAHDRTQRFGSAQLYRPIEDCGIEVCTGNSDLSKVLLPSPALRDRPIRRLRFAVMSN